MASDRDLLRQDLDLLERMTAILPRYLPDDTSYWDPPAPDMPKLTIGGCVMRQDRLRLVQSALPPADQARLDKAIAQFDNMARESVVHFEARSHQELHARLGEWVRYLADLSRHMMTDPGYFADKVDVRVVIEAMTARLRQPPFHLEEQIPAEVQSLDNNLRSRWQTGAFIWPAVWQPAYDARAYWFLYGTPR